MLTLCTFPSLTSSLELGHYLVVASLNSSLWVGPLLLLLPLLLPLLLFSISVCLLLCPK